MVRIIRIILLTILFLLIPLVIYLLYNNLIAEQVNIQVYRNTKKVPAVHLSKFYGKNCWFSGIAAPLKEETLISPLTKKPCLYYNYTKERERQVQDGDSLETVWEIVEKEQNFIDINIIVGKEETMEYSLAGEDVLFIAKSVADRKKAEGLTIYRIREQIVPVNAKVWIFGRPDESEIKRPFPDFIVLVTGTPESFVAGLYDNLNLKIVLSFIILFFSIGPALGIIYNLQPSGKKLIPQATDIALLSFAFLLVWWFIVSIFIMIKTENSCPGFISLLFSLIFLIILFFPIKTKLVQLLFSFLSLFLCFGLFLILMFVINQFDLNFLFTGAIIIAITIGGFLIIIKKAKNINDYLEARARQKYRKSPSYRLALSKIPPTKKKSTCLICNTVNPPGVRCCATCGSFNLKEVDGEE